MFQRVGLSRCAQCHTKGAKTEAVSTVLAYTRLTRTISRAHRRLVLPRVCRRAAGVGQDPRVPLLARARHAGGQGEGREPRVLLRHLRHVCRWVFLAPIACGDNPWKCFSKTQCRPNMHLSRSVHVRVHGPKRLRPNRRLCISVSLSLFESIRWSLDLLKANISLCVG